jgi:hypothetical protein
MFELDMGVKKSIAIAKLLEDVLPEQSEHPADERQGEESPE